MLVPEKHQRIPFRERQRARMLKERRSDATLPRPTGSDAVTALARNKSRFLLIAMGLFVVLGIALVSRSCSVAGSRTGPTRRSMTAVRELSALHGGLEGYKWDCGEYPAESNGLSALIFKYDNPKWNGPYVSFLRSDPWRRPYLYRLQGTGFVLKSLGPDGVESPDDIQVGAEWTNYVEFAPVQPPVNIP
jgi:general secretion pathway protein G